MQASGISGAVAIDVGDRSSCALLGSGSIRCWGRSPANGQSSDSNTPVTLPG